MGPGPDESGEGAARPSGARPARRWSDQSGAALVEFAFVATALLTLVCGTIDLGRAYFTWQSVKNAAREGAAYAERYPLYQKPNGSSCANPDNITYRAQTEGGAQNTDYTVSVTPSVTNGCQATSDHQAINPGDQVTVQVSTTMGVITPFVAQIIGGNVTIRASQTVVVQG